MVVGIERYEAGDRWNLDGCAASAMRIVRWLRACQVPAENITVRLSPLEENLPAVKQGLADLGLPPEPVPATLDEISRVVTEQLPETDGDLLVLFWSGHGALDDRKQRRLFCANMAANAKYNVNVTDLLAALSDKDFTGLSEQVIIVDACANFAQDRNLRRKVPDSNLALGKTRSVRQHALLAAAQGEEALLQKGRAGRFGGLVADWLEQHATELPPAMDQLGAWVVAEFEKLRAQRVTRQHPAFIREILHADETEHVFGGEPVPMSAWRAARAAGLPTELVRTTAALVAATPQMATEGNRAALAAALQDVTGPLESTGDPDADLFDLVSAVLGERKQKALFDALLKLAGNDEEQTAAIAVRHRWGLRSAVAPLLDSLRQTPWPLVRKALTDTVPDVPGDISEVDQALEMLADRPGQAVPPLAEFVVRLQQRRPELEQKVGAAWFASRGLDEAAVAELRTRLAAEAQMRRRKLVIDLRASTLERWQTTVTGYLGPRWWPQTVPCQPEAAGVREAVVKLVGWAKARAADLAIGFLLGQDLMRALPEQWEYEDLAILPIRLCEEHPVVLHAAERMAIPDLLTVWGSKLAAIDRSADDPPGVLWLDRDDAAAIRRAVRASKDAYVAFSFVPEARQDPRASAVMAAIAAGAPSVVWVQAPPADGYDLRARVGELLGPIRDFPEALWEGRVADPYMSDALRVIWDHLDELPPPVDGLGKELVSNG